MNYFKGKFRNAVIGLFLIMLTISSCSSSDESGDEGGGSGSTTYTITVTPSDGESDILFLVNPNIQITFNNDGGAMTAAEITFNTTNDSCGNYTVQVSIDDFSSCLQLDSAYSSYNSSSSSGNGYLTLRPVGGMTYGNTYKIKVLTSDISTEDGVYLDTDYVMTTGFETCAKPNIDLAIDTTTDLLRSVNLDATGTTSNCGGDYNNVPYEWTILSRPAADDVTNDNWQLTGDVTGDKIDPSYYNEPIVFFVADATGDYTIRFTMNEGAGDVTHDVTISVSDVAAPVLPDTGMTTCFDGTGDVMVCPSDVSDPLYQDGSLTTNAPSLTNRGDGTSYDSNTQLIWASALDTMSYADANTYCSNLETGGYIGRWRLPTAHELASLINYETPNIFGEYLSGGSLIPKWTIDIFSATENWVVTSFNGNVGKYTSNDPSTDNVAVRCVRRLDPTTPVLWSGNFTDNSDDTVTHAATGLMWEKGYVSGDATGDWEAAIDYCATLTLATHSDWRLPTIAELISIVPYNNTVNGGLQNYATYFPYTDTSGDTYWSSTTLDWGNDTYHDYAWNLDFATGFTDAFGTGVKTTIKRIKCVRP